MIFKNASVLTEEELHTVNKVIEHLAENLQKNIKVKELAKAFHIGIAKLQAGFKAKTGSPIHAYLTTLRMERAKELLRSPQEISVKSVSIMVGYKTPNHFVDAFKTLVGVTPLQYRSSTQ